MRINFQRFNFFKISSRGIVKLVSGALAAQAVIAFAAPSGADIKIGSGSIVQSGQNTQITQNSQKLSIDWNSFGVLKNESVEFKQPSRDAIALNRVVGGEKSVIDGALKANGQVWILNSNGVLFGKNASINVSGLVASTLNISDKDFMASNYLFESTGSLQSVINAANIEISNGGYAIFVAKEIQNIGSITANGGKAALAGADSVSLNLAGNSLISFAVKKEALDAVVENSGGIYANGGGVYLNAGGVDALLGGVVNNSGIIEAKSVGDLLGEVKIQTAIAVNNGAIDVGGKNGGIIETKAALIIDAGRSNADGTQKGGAIKQEATKILQSKFASLSANSADGKGGVIALKSSLDSDSSFYLSGSMSATGKSGGDIKASANALTVAGANIDASGTNKAGSVKLGGGWQGKDESVANAKKTVIDSKTTIKANGEGGEVVVWSDKESVYAADIKAKNANVEISSKENLTYGGTVEAKSLLLDPKNIENPPHNPNPPPLSSNHLKI